MGKVMVSNYRYVSKEENKDFAVRHVLNPGDDPKDLPKDVRDDLEKRGLIKDERQFDEATNTVLPPAMALQRYEKAEREKAAEGMEEVSVSAPTSTVGGSAKTAEEAAKEERKKQPAKEEQKQSNQ